MKKHYDVGVVGCWYWGNYGSLLNGYATYKILKSFGLSVLNIVTPQNGFEPHAKKFFNIAYNKDEISEILPFDRVKEFNKICDTFITGSDQIWNYNGPHNKQFEDFFRLNFVEDSKKKISFATSFGDFSRIPPFEQLEKWSALMKRYDAISVRENAAVDICRRYFCVDATQVMEPVLDVELNVWNELASHSTLDVSEKYLLTYILDPTPQKVKSIQYYASKLGLKILNIVDGFSGKFEENKRKLGLENILPNIWCADFIKLFSNASYIITDSFHGAAFSIIFNKTFLCITNKKRGLSRFETLLSKINLMDCLVDENQIPLDDKYLHTIDYTLINKIIKDERIRSLTWLKSALFNPCAHITIKNNVEERLVENHCMGCGACASSCPVNAIQLIEDKFGYYRRKVDDAKCINCGKCAHNCAALSPPKTLNAKTPVSYAFVHKNHNVLMNSTSGGAFAALSKLAFRQNGAVVGVTLDDDFTAKHIIIENEQDFKQLQKSKYMQSKTGTIYKDIELRLKNKQFVLFSGCPCQVAGLQKYLNKDYDNLITVDLFCFVCPSAKIFKQYLNENFKNIKSFEFRHKNESDTLWSADCISITDIKNKTHIIRKPNNIYQDKMFVMSPSHCRVCHYQGTTRLGDISIGDCWGIQNYDSSIKSSYGVSAILVNNSKGKNYLAQLSHDDIEVLKEEPLECIKIYNNGAFQENRNWPTNPMRDVFYAEIESGSWNNAIHKAMLNK